MNSSSSASQQWKDANLPKVLDDCQRRLTEMEETKKHSVTTKKALAEQTREFNKLAPEASHEAISNLLRLYQIEIESLSKRCRYSETSFAQLVNLLAPLPDPSVAVCSNETATLQTATAGIESAAKIADLTKTISDLESELGTLKNQDVAVRRLEKRVNELESQKRSEFAALEVEWSGRLNVVQAESEQAKLKLQLEVDERNKEIQKLTSDLSHASSQAETKSAALKTTLKTKSAEIEEMTNQIETLRDQLAVARKNNAEHLGMDESHTRVVDMYKERLEKSSEKVSQLDQELTRDRLVIAETEKRLVNESVAHQKEVAAIRAQLEKQGEYVNELVDILNPAASVLQTLSSPKSSAKAVVDVIHKLKLEVSDSNQQKVKLEQQVKDLSIKLSNEKVTNPSVIPSGDSPIPGESNNLPNNVLGGILQSQRDRFKSRVVELEAERDSLKQIQADLNNRIANLTNESRRIENEKNFWKQQNSREGGDVELGDFSKRSGQPPSLYKKTDSRNGTVVQGHGQTFEQSFVSLISHAISNPIMRRAGLVYLLTLHLLVFMVLYRLSSLVNSNSS